MKSVILAAGKGSRLLPLTKDKPKCMVEYKGKKIIDYILSVIECEKIIVCGYKCDVLKKELQNVIFVENRDYNRTNMVYSLFLAKSFMDDDIIVSYADIIYTKDILEQLKKCNGDICVVIDKKWETLWSKRMENPLLDAETLKLDKDGYIKEIGKKPKNKDEIEAQYIGLIKFSKGILKKVIEFYEKGDFSNAYMTDFLQALIDKGFKITPVIIEGGWVEIDRVNDLKVVND